MHLYTYTLYTIAAFVAGWRGSVVIRNNAARLGLVQAPNERSSHVVPTPQGGGIAIAIVAIVATGIASLADGGMLTVLVLVGAIAALGLTDDILDLSPALRFPIQGVVVATLVGWALPVPDLVLPFGIVLGGWLLVALIWLAAMWWVNLFNFMDGIDGIAGSQAVLVLLGGLVIALSVDPTFLGAPIAFVMIMTSAATLGFLVLNWAPARIFMGDSGSNALAVLIVCAILVTLDRGLVGYPAWLILLAPFGVDATIALIRRTARGEWPWRAHRRHAYQQLARRWKHGPVTLLYCGFAVVAIVLAWIAQQFPELAWWLVGAAYACLVAFVLAGGSGSRAERG